MESIAGSICSNDERSEIDDNDDDYSYNYSVYEYGDYHIIENTEDEFITASFQRMCSELNQSAEIVCGCGGQRITVTLQSSSIFFNMDNDRLTALNINGLLCLSLQYDQNIERLQLIKINCENEGLNNVKRSHQVKWLETSLDKFVKEIDGPKFSKKRKLLDVDDETVEDNILQRIVDKIKDIVLNRHKYCLVCDDPVENIGVYPTPCDKDFCSFSHEELGIGLPLEHMIEHNSMVVDLLVTFFAAAVNDGRAELFYPSRINVDVFGVNKSFILPNGLPEWSMVREVTVLMPPIDEMLRNVTNLRIYLDTIHVLMYPLLRWILATNRSHLRYISPELQSELNLKDVCTHLFVLITGPYKKEISFQKLKQAASEVITEVNVEATHNTGSLLAFHGSPCGNWHSILRMGIKNFSNTKYMTVGAAYGEGAYFSESMNTCIPYSHASSIRWLNSKLVVNGALSCLAVCELAKTVTPYNGTHKIPSGMHVIQDEDRIMTRFLLINPTTNSSFMASSLYDTLSACLTRTGDI